MEIVEHTPSPFIHLRVHSAYSLAEGAMRLEQLIELAQKHNMPAVAVTDSGNLFGALEFSVLAQAKGIQPIIGCELLVYQEHPTQSFNKEKCCKVVLLVQNEQGYQNLLKLVSRSFLNTSSPEEPHIAMEDFLDPQQVEGLILLSGWKGGLLSFSKDKKEIESFLFQVLKTFPGRFYLEIQRHGNPEEDSLEEYTLTQALAYNIPIVATNNVFFPDRPMYEAHDALLCIAEGAYVTEENRRKVTPEHYFKSSREMTEIFQDLPEALANTYNIACRCSFFPKKQAPMLPSFPCENYSCEEEELRHQAQKGLQERLLLHLKRHPDFSEQQIKKKKKEYEARLIYELEIIIKMGFSGYFLIVSDFIKWAKNQKIPVGPGRGSGAGSLVAWSLMITDIDPIRFNLLFERFLNPERVSMPDFDIDFCQDRRDEVISYVQKKYGADRVAQIITFGKLQARAVLRDVGRVLQIPYPVVDRICKLVPNNPANPTTLSEAIEQEVQLREEQRKDAKIKKLISIALQLEGLYRHASTHAAGVIISGQPLDKVIPLYRDPRSEMPVTQFNMKYVEQAGLVKFDFLGLKTLSVLENAVQRVQERGQNVDLSLISLTDSKTFKLLNRVETLGVFQLESPGMRDVLRKLKPTRFEDIIALVALYRPGPMDNIPMFIAFKHGEEEVTYMHPSHKAILQETYGVMIYQEQVMQIAQVQAGYSLGKADLLRRAMGKKIKSEMNAQRKLFIAGSEKNNIKADIANQIFDQVAKFAGYGFNKSHAASYALIAYQTAYMKANYPLEFMAALMSYDLNNTDKLNIYRQELKHMGITLFPPDVNQSDAFFKVQGNGIRFALAAIKNVGEQAMRDLVCEREKGGHFRSLEDFAQRLSSKTLNKRQMESLIYAGAFDTLFANRRQIFESLENILDYGHKIQKDISISQSSLFGKETHNTLEITLKKTKEWSFDQKLKNEFLALGFYLSAHPLDKYKEIFSQVSIRDSLDLPSISESVFLMAGVVLDKKVRISKKGKKFAFLSLSDLGGAFEVTLFSEVLLTAEAFLEPGSLLILSVQARKESENIRLTAHTIEPIEKFFQHKIQGIRIVLESIEACRPIKQLLENAPIGPQEVYLECFSHTLNKTIIFSVANNVNIFPEICAEISDLTGVETLEYCLKTKHMDGL